MFPFLESPAFGSFLLKVLLYEYLILMLAFIPAKNWGNVAYFMGSAILTFGIMMKNK